MIVAVISQKGGVSKSTIATNLAAAAYLARKKALVIDLDRQSTADDWFASRGENSPLKGLDVLRPPRPDEGGWLVDWIRKASQAFDYVTLDCPGELCPTLEHAATIADVIVMPARPGMADIWAMNRTLTTKIASAAQRRKKEGRKAAPIVVVVTQAVEKTRNQREAVVELEKYGQVGGILHHRQVYTDALSIGESVLTMEPDGAAAKEILSLYRATLKAAGRSAKE